MFLRSPSLQPNCIANHSSDNMTTQQTLKQLDRRVSSKTQDIVRRGRRGVFVLSLEYKTGSLVGFRSQDNKEKIKLQFLAHLDFHSHLHYSTCCFKCSKKLWATHTWHLNHQISVTLVFIYWHKRRVWWQDQKTPTEDYELRCFGINIQRERYGKSSRTPRSTRSNFSFEYLNLTFYWPFNVRIQCDKKNTSLV